MEGEFPELKSSLCYKLNCIINTFAKQSLFRSWLGIPGVCLVWFPVDYTHQSS